MSLREICITGKSVHELVANYCDTLVMMYTVAWPPTPPTPPPQMCTFINISRVFIKLKMFLKHIVNTALVAWLIGDALTGTDWSVACSRAPTIVEAAATLGTYIDAAFEQRFGQQSSTPTTASPLPSAPPSRPSFSSASPPPPSTSAASALSGSRSTPTDELSLFLANLHLSAFEAKLRDLGAEVCSFFLLCILFFLDSVVTTSLCESTRIVHR